MTVVTVYSPAQLVTHLDVRRGGRKAPELDQVAAEIAAAQARAAAREASVPTIRYPPELPITSAR